MFVKKNRQIINFGETSESQLRNLFELIFSSNSLEEMSTVSIEKMSKWRFYYDLNLSFDNFHFLFLLSAAIEHSSYSSRYLFLLFEIIEKSPNFSDEMIKLFYVSMKKRESPLSINVYT